MDKTLDDLFRLVQEYQPQQVGIEVTGQQQAFIKWLSREMMIRNIWFNFASDKKTGEPGIRPDVDKLKRFNLVVPWFKAGKFYFPIEMKTTSVLGEGLSQIRLATTRGLKGKDDFIDTVSMLGFLNPWRPSDAIAKVEKDTLVWDDDVERDNSSPLSSYIV
jgi:phage terminase large subunit-like protein